MQVIYDEEEYARTAEVFLRNFVRAMASVLHQSPRVDLDLNNVTEAELDLVFNVCFVALANLEDHGGLQVPDERRFAHLTFSPNLHDPEVFYAGKDRTLLHGGVSDELIASVIEELRQQETDGISAPAGVRAECR